VLGHLVLAKDDAASIMLATSGHVVEEEEQQVPATFDPAWEPHPTKKIKLVPGIMFLQEMLQQALEVELSLIPPYISAYYSLHAGKNTNASLLLHGIAMEEMLHMATISNLLNAVGGHPRIDHPSFAATYPSQLPFEGAVIDVAPFSPKQVTAFRNIERPMWANGTDHTVGIFLARTITIIDLLVLCHGEAAVFVGDPALQ